MLSISGMKAWILLMVLLCWVAVSVRAEDSRLQQSTSAAEDAAFYNKLVPLETAPANADVITKKNFRISGPLVRPFKAKKIAEVPKRILHLINPFARPDSTLQTQRVGDLNPRAWSTIIGWGNGGSAFPDAITHESQMSLISINSSGER